jgi:hypothetical protein
MGAVADMIETTRMPPDGWAFRAGATTPPTINVDLDDGE